MKNHRVNSLFFDLDGTLFDTAADITTALNKVLQRYDQPVVSFDHVRQYVALGSKAILTCGFSSEAPSFDMDQLRDEFLLDYRKHLVDQTTLYDGMADVLNYLDEARIPWGVVTNKPGWLAEPILVHFELNQRSRCLIAGDTLSERKPHPLPLFRACEIVGVNPNKSAYVGDTETDVQAAKAAGMLSILAQYGYGTPHEVINANSDTVIQQPVDILRWLVT